jgi:hypothetical protein
MDRPRRSGGEEWRDAAIAVGLAAVALLGWLWLSGWEWRRLANPDPMSSLGVLLIAAVVGVACFIAWLRDWRASRPATPPVENARPDGPEMSEDDMGRPRSDAFFLEHRSCGDLDAGMSDESVWFMCVARGVRIERPVAALARSRKGSWTNSTSRAFRLRFESGTRSSTVR